jgi:hypothetical protein
VDKLVFRAPPAEMRPVAMWFLNGPLDDDQLRRQIGEMAGGGIGGVQVAARTGLETPYLSERWFEIIRLIIDESNRHGMAVWLADEYPYPSGVSGGEVILRHAEFRAWQMHARRLVARAGEHVRVEAPGTVLLRAVAVPHGGAWADARILDGHVGLWQRDQVLFQPSSVYLTRQRYMNNAPRPCLEWRAPADADWEVWLIAAAEITDYKFFGGYVDLCNAEAGREFLETTYQRYAQRLGPWYFDKLAGFFLDEAHPQNWSWSLPEYFRQHRGYDLIQALPALFTDIGPQTPRIRYDYWQSITELFVDSFHKPLAEWCTSHGVQLSLEVPSTRNVVQRYSDIPGIDPGHDKVGTPLDDILARELGSYRGNLTFPASLASQTGRKRVLDELFHSVGWSLTLQDMKAMLDRAAGRGANLFAFHAFCYTIGGLRKWDAPPSEFEQNPYWQYFSLLSNYAGRLAYAMSRGRRAANIAVLDPVSTLWTHQDATGSRDETARRVVADWTAILRELTATQRPHDTIDPLILAEADVSRGVVRVGDAAYQLIVLPSLTSLESAAWLKLEEFVSNGGTVIAFGELPGEEIAMDGDVVQRCAGVFSRGERGFKRVSDLHELLTLLDEILPADIRIVPPSRDVLVAHRRDSDEDLFLIANSAESPLTCELRFRQPLSGGIVRYDLEGGDSEPVAVVDGGVRLDFAPYGCHLIAVGGPLAPPQMNASPVDVVDLDLDAEWRCEATGDNTLRLDRFDFTMQSTWHAAVSVAPKPLINLLQDVAGMGQAWPGEIRVQPIFGAPPRIELKLPGVARYRATFEVVAVPSRAVVCLEDLSLAGDWTISLNGAAIPRSEFVANRHWDIGNREASVQHLLRVGANELDVEVHVVESWDGLLDALHLLGDFGVYFEDHGQPVLRGPARSLRWSERHTSGYPYYAGTLQLSRALSLPEVERPLRLQLPDSQLMFAGVAELHVNGQSLGVRAWAPFAWTLPPGGGGSNSQVTLSITNTLIEALEGRYYDPLTRQFRASVSRS